MGITKFIHHPQTDFSENENNLLMKGALTYVRSELGKTYPILIGDKKYNSSTLLVIKNPSNPREIVGKIFKAEKKHAQKAIEVSLENLEEWQAVDIKIRVKYLLNIANVMRQRQMDLASWMIYEIGKSWTEADIDVAKAIDFLEFYAREAIRLTKSISLTKIPTEKNDLWHMPLGMGVILPSWNNPLSNLVNMTIAAVVSGNSVILKPSSNAPIIGYKFMEILQELEFPPGIVNYLPGAGPEIGSFLVSHPKTRFIVFSGRNKTGLEIQELAAKVVKGQIWTKRVLLDMGGKNSIIVDKTADLDKATAGIVTSVFSFQGQKCSSCSRVIIDKTVYQTMINKILKKVRKIRIGNPINYENTFGAVINESSQNKILDYIEIGKQSCKMIYGGKKRGKRGFFIEPTIFIDVPIDAKIAQEEILGPVLSISKAKHFDDAVEIANNTIYGLVGSVYTKSTRNMRHAKENFEVGNLYFNRETINELVDVHPFGGLKLSGTNQKSGGGEYLQLFMQTKSISAMR